MGKCIWCLFSRRCVFFCHVFWIRCTFYTKQRRTWKLYTLVEHTVIKCICRNTHRYDEKNGNYGWIAIVVNAIPCDWETKNYKSFVRMLIVCPMHIYVKVYSNCFYFKLHLHFVLIHGSVQCSLNSWHFSLVSVCCTCGGLCKVLCGRFEWFCQCWLLRLFPVPFKNWW